MLKKVIVLGKEYYRDDKGNLLAQCSVCGEYVPKAQIEKCYFCGRIVCAQCAVSAQPPMCSNRCFDKWYEEQERVER